MKRIFFDIGTVTATSVLLIFLLYAPFLFMGCASPEQVDASRKMVTKFSQEVYPGGVFLPDSWNNELAGSSCQVNERTINDNSYKLTLTVYRRENSSTYDIQEFLIVTDTDDTIIRVTKIE